MKSSRRSIASTGSAVKNRVAGSFSILRVSGKEDRSKWSSRRMCGASIVESHWFDMVMGVLILSNLVVMVLEADANATCVKAGPTCPPKILQTLNQALLGVYTAEAALRMYVYRGHYWTYIWNVLDFTIVVVGFVDIILARFEEDIPNVQMLRVFRVLRLVRTIRLLAVFPELYQMVRGFTSAMKAMLWGGVLIAIMLMIWSLLTVELIHPWNTEVEHDSEWCSVAFSSVMSSTLFFFQTLVAGDSWGTCAVPLVRAHPIAIIIFAGALVSVQLGFTNLVLTVIVEAAAEARESDHVQRLKDKMQHEQQSFERWQKFVKTLDKDNSGTISLEELLAGYDAEADLQRIFKLLDIGRGDLEILFQLMDNDESGDLSYEEFFDCLRKAHAQDMRMFLMNVRLQVTHISHLLRRQLHGIGESLEKLAGAPMIPKMPAERARRGAAALPAPPGHRTSKTKWESFDDANNLKFDDEASTASEAPLIFHSDNQVDNEVKAAAPAPAAGDWRRGPGEGPRGVSRALEERLEALAEEVESSAAQLRHSTQLLAETLREGLPLRGTGGGACIAASAPRGASSRSLSNPLGSRWRSRSATGPGSPGPGPAQKPATSVPAANCNAAASSNAVVRREITQQGAI